MSDDEILASSEDGTLSYMRLSAKYLEDTLNVFKNCFLKHENVCRATRVAEFSEAVEESAAFSLYVASEGISVITVEKATNKVVGIAINKLNLKSDQLDESFYEKFKHPAIHDLIKFGITMENEKNLFELCNADCVFEILFLSTVPEFRGKGIAKRLCELSIEIAEKLHKGQNVRKPLDESPLPLDFRPKVVSSLFTSFITQKIGRQLNFEIANSRSFEEFTTHDGRIFASVIGNHTKNATFEYKKLQYNKK